MSRPFVRFLALALLAPVLLFAAVAAADPAAAPTAPMRSPPAVPGAGEANNGGDFVQQLDSAIRQLEQQNQDIWRELDEDYAYIIGERDTNAANIAKQIEAAKDAHDKALAEIDRQKADLEKQGEKTGAPASDPQKLENQKNLDQDTAAANLAYDFNLANLQQLYQLNSRRYDELMKVHDQRDNLEDRRILEEKNLAALELALQYDAAKPNLTPAQKDMNTYFLNALASAKEDAQTRYRDSNAALDEYRDLVIKRLNFLKENLADQAKVMAKLAQPGLDRGERDKYLKEIAEIAFKKDVEEKIHQNEVRFIEEKFAYERDRTHELASLATQRRDLDTTLSDFKTQAWLEMAELNRKLEGPGLTQADRDNLNARMEVVKTALSEHEKDYRDAVKNLTRRREIVKKGLDERLAYIRERNQLRNDMYAEPVTSTSHQKFRDRIVELQNRHIAQEAANREQLAQLAQVVPPTFAFSPWQRGDMDIRLNRLRERMGDVRDQLKQSLDRDIGNLDKQAMDINLRLGGADLSGSLRQKLEQRLADLNKQILYRNNDYNQAMNSAEANQAAEEKKIMARGQYIDQRNELLKDLALSDFIGSGAASAFGKLQKLDSEWQQREKLYRQNARPLSGVFKIERFETYFPVDVYGKDSAPSPAPASEGPTEPTAQVPTKTFGPSVPVPAKTRALISPAVATLGDPLAGKEIGLALPH